MGAVATWETNDSSYRATLRPSSEFSADSYRRKDHQKGVTLILGKHSSDASLLMVQSVVFDKEVFDALSDAKSWWSEHGADVDKTYDARAGKPLDNKGIKELGGINKRVVAVHAAPDSTGALYSAVQPPNDKQLELINQFTRSEKGAEQLAVFPVLACNDVIDRDVDQFTTETVKGFMNLEGPLSPVGKSFMVGHDYSKLPVGRIFDGETVTKDDITHLKLWTYIPNTEQYKSYLENVDFGVYWAVSVGVMLGAAICSVGEEHAWGWHPYVCSAYHIKGERYDPDGERDKYDQPVPDPDGKLAWRKLIDPTDFYELSQVYLGAQYMAEYDKGIGAHAANGLKRMAGIAVKGVKTAANLHEQQHVTMLSTKEAEKLPPLFPAQSKAADAAAKGITIKQDEDGLYTWVDREGLVWNFRPETEEELCLGRKATGTGEAHESSKSSLEAFRATVGRLKAATDEKGGDDSAKSLLESLESVLEEAASALEDEDYDKVTELIDGAKENVSTLMETLGVANEEGDEEDGDEEEDDEPTLGNRSEPEEDDLSKKAVKRAAVTAKLPTTVVEAVEKAIGDSSGLDELLGAVGEHIGGLEKQVADLTPKAQAGEAFLKELRAEAIHFYVMSHKGPGEKKGVDTGSIERLLNLAADDVDLLKEIRDQQKETARSRFPEAVRRSTFPDNANERNDALGEGQPNTVSTEGVKRIHG